MISRGFRGLFFRIHMTRRETRSECLLQCSKPESIRSRQGRLSVFYDKTIFCDSRRLGLPGQSVPKPDDFSGQQWIFVQHLPLLFKQLKLGDVYSLSESGKSLDDFYAAMVEMNQI